MIPDDNMLAHLLRNSDVAHPAECARDTIDMKVQYVSRQSSKALSPMPQSYNRAPGGMYTEVESNQLPGGRKSNSGCSYCGLSALEVCLPACLV